MSQAQARQQACYLSATQRDRCGSCKHVEQVFADRAPPWDRAGWRCSLHDFAVTTGAICTSFQAARRVSRTGIETPPPL